MFELLSTLPVYLQAPIGFIIGWATAVIGFKIGILIFNRVNDKKE